MHRMLVAAVATLAGSISVAQTVPPQTALADGHGNIWTLVNGVVYVENSGTTAPVKAGMTQGVTELARDASGLIWQYVAAHKLWWVWNGTEWTPKSGQTAGPVMETASSSSSSSSSGGAGSSGSSSSSGGSASSIVFNASATLIVTCPVTLTTLLAAVNSNMQCTVQVNKLTVTTTTN